MNFETWLKSVPSEIADDSLWKMEGYRLALFAADLAWHDITRLASDRRTGDRAGQLYSAVGSAAANISEGYSRGSGRDRARFYEWSWDQAGKAVAGITKGGMCWGKP